MPPKQSNIYRSGINPAEALNSSSSSDEEEQEEIEIPVQTEAKPVQDRRLQRLEALKVENEGGIGERQIQREKALKRRQQQEKEMANEMPNEVEEPIQIETAEKRMIQSKNQHFQVESSSSSDESTSSEDDDEEKFPKRVLFKPVFVPK